MKKLLVYLYFLVFSSALVFGIQNSINNKCEGMRDNVFSPDLNVHDTCILDDFMKEYIACRAYYNKNMMNGLDSDGNAELDSGTKLKGQGGYKAIDNYNFFDKEIKRALLKEVKKQIAKSQSIMCTKNSEDDLFKYQISIAEHEWCYAPKFLEAFNDEFMTEQEMKSKYFMGLYNIRSTMLESKEKPKNKGVLCGVYLECMSSFIHANHTEVSNGLSTLYEKTKKECRSNYFVIETKMERKEESRKDRGENVMISGPKSLLSSWNTTQISKQIMHVNAANGNIGILALKGDAHSSKRGSSYRFNSASCSYETKSKTSKDENLDYDMAELKQHDIGMVDDDKATIELEVRNAPFKKKFSIDWKTLQNSGSWSGHGSYHKRHHSDGLDLEVPKGMGELSGIANKVKGLVTAMRKEVGPKSKEMVQMGIDNFGRSKKENCHQMRVHEGFFVNEEKTSSTDIEVDITIRDATKLEIDLMENVSDKEGMRSYRAKKIKQSKFEKKPQSLFDSLQNSVYTDMSQKDKKAWDKADKEHKKEVQNKKDLEEFNNLSIDDLEMFTK